MYFPSEISNMRSVLAKILNSTAEGLNNKPKLPRYVLIMLDKDLIEYFNYYEYSMGDMLTDTLKWLVKELMKQFDIRRDDLRTKRPGAIGVATEPRLIWIAMIVRPQIDGPMSKIFAARSKYNRVLEDVLSEFKYNHIMYLDTMKQANLFDSQGRLTAAGKTEMWNDVNHQIHLFDHEEWNLKPIHSAAKAAKVSNRGDGNSRS